jgi:hypothetical protein
MGALGYHQQSTFRLCDVRQALYNKKVIASGAQTERRERCRAGEELAWR